MISAHVCSINVVHKAPPSVVLRARSAGIALVLPLQAGQESLPLQCLTTLCGQQPPSRLSCGERLTEFTHELQFAKE